MSDVVRRPALQRAADRVAELDVLARQARRYEFASGMWRRHLHWPPGTPLLGEQLLRAALEGA